MSVTNFWIGIINFSQIVIFAWHRIYIHVRKIEYWSNGDKIRNKIPFDFESYKSYIFSQKYIFDSYIVFTNIKREGLAGMALIGTVCSRSSIAFVDGGNRSRFNEKTVAETLAHELGHSFGFDHVESKYTVIYIR
ncbi:hypothetical protein HZS_90 [Henneguya salminicola]|nr:hypothetical protein HZS_90 [Henneguya salminicola]